MNAKKIMGCRIRGRHRIAAACGGVKDDATAGNAITVGTTDKITSLDPAGSYDNGSYAVQIQVFPFLYAQNYNTSELSPDIAADDGTWSADGTEFTVKLKSGLKFANGHDLTSSDVKFSFDRVKKINDENGPSSLLANITDVKAKDDTTVVFTCRTTTSPSSRCCPPAGPIVDEESFLRQADRRRHHRQDNAFAGPYKLTAFKINESAAYAKNDSYKGPDPGQELRRAGQVLRRRVQPEDGRPAGPDRRGQPLPEPDRHLRTCPRTRGQGCHRPGRRRALPHLQLQDPALRREDQRAERSQGKAVRQAVANLIDRDELA